MVNPAITNNAVAGMPLAQAGVAAAIASTSRQVGAALGVAVAGTARRKPNPRFRFHPGHPSYLVDNDGMRRHLTFSGWVSTTVWAHTSTNKIASLLGGIVPMTK